MKRMLVSTLITIAVCFLLFFPFIHVGGSYYRSLILIWHQYSLRARSSGGFINLTPDINLYEIVWWANPFTFRYVENGYAVDTSYVYLGQRLDSMDVKTFRVLGNGFYADKTSVRLCGGLIRKRTKNGNLSENFDPETIQLVGANFVKDKTGIYYLSPMEESESETNKYHKSAMGVSIFTKLENVDFETFEHVEKCIFKDKNFTYKANICGDFSCESGIRLSFDSSHPEVLEIIK